MSFFSAFSQDGGNENMATKLNDKYLQGFIKAHEYEGVVSAMTI